ncbi:hypothetical protein ACFOYV_18820, partial [Pseudophaeobacter arcticus]
QGKKIGDNLCGRDDSCDQHVMQLRHREKRGGREGNPGEQPMELPGAVSFLPSHHKPQSDGFARC